MPRTRTTVIASAIALCLLIAIIAVSWQQQHTRNSWSQSSRHTVGDSTAPIHLVEFADFQCPHCATFASTVSQLKNTLVANGTLRIEYRHYPFLGEQSDKAALASECAGDQDRFWEYHDLLYIASINDQIFGKDLYDDIAQAIGLDYIAWDFCYTSQTYEKLIKSDRQYGRHLGVQGTPYLFINEVHYRGNRDYFSIYDYIVSTLPTTAEPVHPSPATPTETP